MALRVHIHPIHNVWDLSQVHAAQTCQRLHCSHTQSTNTDEGSKTNFSRIFKLGSCASVYKDGFNCADRSSPDVCAEESRRY